MRDAWLITQNFLRKLVLQRTLLRNLVVRDLRSRYVGSFMGLFWSVIHPLALLLTYTLVFSGILKIQPWKQAGIQESFAVVIFCGILPWLLFQDTVTRSAMAVIDHANLVKKTRFPIEIVSLSIFLANLFSHLVGLGILIAVLAWLRGLSPWVLLLPVFWLCLMLLSVGLGWVVAVLQVFLRDTAQVLTVVMGVWFWLTPIFYSIDMVPEPVRGLVRFNPLADVIVGYRDCLLLKRAPDPASLLLLALGSTAVFVIGGIFFRVSKREFVDVL